MSEGERMTKQGSLILECLKNHENEHLTAEKISECLKKEGAIVSTATIYRHLEKLTAKGLIRKFLYSPDEPACYQFFDTREVCHNHFHLKCTVCSELFHVSCPYLDKLEEHINQHHGFSVDNTRTVLYGICKSCRRKSKKGNSAEL